MTDNPRILGERLGLIEAVDHLLDRGAVVVGDAVISLAQVDLVYLRLSLMLASVETLRSKYPQARAGGAYARSPEGTAPPGSPSPSSRVSSAEQRPSASPDNAPASAAGGAEMKSPPASQPGNHPGRARGPDGPSLLPAPSSPNRGERPERGLAQLVLTLVEVLRQVVEHQALRRVEGGGLSDETIERLGLTLAQLEEKMTELRDIFDLKKEDLNIDLGPLGNLL